MSRCPLEPTGTKILVRLRRFKAIEENYPLLADVVAIGPEVKGVKVGDAVMVSFPPKWVALLYHQKEYYVVPDETYIQAFVRE